jgi:hypothetical protein
VGQLIFGGYGYEMAIEDARALIAALADPETLYVFGVIAAGATHIGMKTQPGTRSTRYVTVFGVMRQTSLSREVVEAAAARLKATGVLNVSVDQERGYESWRVSEAALAAAANGVARPVGR